MNDIAAPSKLVSAPTGWASSTLAETCALVFGQSPPSTTYNESGKGLPFFQGKAEFGDLHPQVRKWCSVPNKLAKEGDVLISVRAPVGPTNLAPSDCCIGRGLAAIKPLDQIPAKYVLFYLRSIEKSLADQGTGTTFGAITSRVLEGLQIPIAPLREQQRIVAKIDELFSELDAGLASLKRARALLKKYRQAVLKAAVTGELTRDWRARHEGQIKESGADLLQCILEARRQAWEAAELKKLRAKGKPPKDNRWKEKYKEPQPLDTSGLPELPDGWVWVSIDQLVSGRARSLQSGPFGSNLLHSEFQPTGYLVMGIDNVGEGRFMLGSQNRISEDKFKSLEKYEVRPADVLITVMASLGRSCVVPRDIEPSIVTKHVYRITVEQNLIIPEYLNLVMQGSPEFRNAMFKDARGQTRPGLNGGILKILPVPLPCTTEQESIVAEVDRLMSVADVMEQGFVEELNRSNSVRQSILKAAFTGKLVPQEPADEPASMLLERIRAERAAKPKPGRGRRIKGGKNRKLEPMS